MAQGDFFLKIDGIDGESQDDKLKNHIQVLSVSLGVSNLGTGGSNLGSGASKANVQDIHFTKPADKSSPNIFIHCCSGKHFPTATITMRKAAGDNKVDYLVYKLSEVFISSYNVSAHEGGGIAQESLSLNFSTIEYNYTPQNADGTPGAKITKTYKIKENKVS